MKEKIIQKKLNYKPNLRDYESLRASFSWQKEVLSLPKISGEKINAAHISITLSSEKYGSKTALIWLDGNRRKTFSYLEVEQLSNKFANSLKRLDVRKGDRIFFFLPRIPELYYGFLGTLKLGAIAGTLFPAFGPQALFDRLKNSQAKVLVTDSQLYKRVEKIKAKLPDLEEIILVDKKISKCKFLKELLDKTSEKFSPEPMDFNDPCFMLYTSGTGTTPVSGIVIPHKAIAQQVKTAQWVLDLKAKDKYWCTSDPGWVTGIVYGILSPLALGTTIIVSKNRFDAKLWFSILDKEQVSIFYSAPTAFRFLEKETESAKKYDFKNLRHIASVGEALSPSSINWALETFGTPIHDTWWQTETGAMMIANFPSLPIKPGSMGKPMPGINAEIIDEDGKKTQVGKEGYLVFKPNWPSKMIDIWQNKKRLKEYLKNGWYYSGDKAYKDKDGYFFFIGRADDVIKTSGERVGPFEVESTLQEHESVLESAVIGKPDKQRGEIIKAFVVLRPEFKKSKSLQEELKLYVKKKLAGHAYPREIEFVENLPKTKTGKIMRRYLKAKELGLPTGDISTLDNS